jgi:hypothetical protein
MRRLKIDFFELDAYVQAFQGYKPTTPIKTNIPLGTIERPKRPLNIAKIFEECCNEKPIETIKATVETETEKPIEDHIETPYETILW